jgi:hypothetical protein
MKEITIESLLSIGFEVNHKNAHHEHLVLNVDNFFIRYEYLHGLPAFIELVSNEDIDGLGFIDISHFKTIEQIQNLVNALTLKG